MRKNLLPTSYLVIHKLYGHDFLISIKHEHFKTSSRCVVFLRPIHCDFLQTDQVNLREGYVGVLPSPCAPFYISWKAGGGGQREGPAVLTAGASLQLLYQYQVRKNPVE